MAVYVELRRKKFHQQLQKQTDKLDRKTWNVRGIRRPTVGITVKEDTYCYLRVVTDDGKELTLTGGRDNSPYANFLVTGWHQNHQEKMSVLETMGDVDYLYFFGRKVRAYTLEGILLNTADFNWKAQWLDNFDRYLRGTQLAKSNARLYLYLDGSVIEGYLSATDVPSTTAQRNLVQFTATVLVTDYLDVDAFYDPPGVPAEYVNGIPDGKFPDLSEEARKAYAWTYADVLSVADRMMEYDNPYTTAVATGDYDTEDAEVVGEKALPASSGPLGTSDNSPSMWRANA